MISGYDCAIFDMDGTLLDSMPHWRMQNIYFLQDRNLPVPKEIAESPYFFSSHVAAKLYVQLYDLGISPDAIIEEYIDRMDKAYQSEIQPKKGAKDFLETLKQAGVKMCIATLTPEDVAKRALAKHGLLDYFEFVITSSLSGFNKGDPAYFDMVTAKLGSVSKRCMVFEDSLYAAQGAKKANCRVIAVEDATNVPDQEALKQIADVYIQDFTDPNII